MLNDAMDKVFPVFYFFCVIINRLSHTVCSCQRMEIIIRLGLSKRQNQRNGTPAQVCNPRGMKVESIKARFMTINLSQVLEETGYNLAEKLDPENVVEMAINEQRISLYIVPGVPEDYAFKTKTRKEISVSALSGSLCMIVDYSLRE